MTKLLPQDTALPDGSGLNLAFRMRTRLTITRRLVATLLGSFAFTWGLVAVGVAGLSALEVDYHEAEVVLMLLAFVVFLPLFLWSFASPRQGRVMVLLFGGAVFLVASAWAIQRALLA